MDEDLRQRLLDLAEQDQAHAMAVYEASQKHEPHRGKFLFDIPKEEWLPEYFQSEEDVAARTTALLEIIRERGWSPEMPSPVSSLPSAIGSSSRLVGHSSTEPISSPMGKAGAL